MKLSEHEFKICFRDQSKWEYVREEIQQFILALIENDPNICPSTHENLMNNKDSMTVEWNLRFTENVYLYVQVNESTCEIIGRPSSDTCNVVEVDCKICWGSTQRSVLEAQAALLLYKKAVDLATLIKARYPSKYGFSKTF